MVTGFNNRLNRSGQRRPSFPRSYAEASAIFHSWKSNPRRRRATACKIANNTFLDFDGEHRAPLRTCFKVVLHRTAVVTFWSDGSIVLDSGGWQSATTRDRMNSCGARVGLGGGIARVHHGGRDWTYADGMTLLPDGTVRYAGFVNHDPDSALKLRRRRLAAVNRLVKKDLSYYSDCLTPEQRETLRAAWYWEGRQGGRARGGNAPEAFEAAS